MCIYILNLYSGFKLYRSLQKLLHFIQKNVKVSIKIVSFSLKISFNISNFPKRCWFRFLLVSSIFYGILYFFKLFLWKFLNKIWRNFDGSEQKSFLGSCTHWVSQTRKRISAKRRSLIFVCDDVFLFWMSLYSLVRMDVLRWDTERTARTCPDLSGWEQNKFYMTRWFMVVGFIWSNCHRGADFAIN